MSIEAQGGQSDALLLGFNLGDQISQDFLKNRHHEDNIRVGHLQKPLFATRQSHPGFRGRFHIPSFDPFDGGFRHKCRPTTTMTSMTPPIKKTTKKYTSETFAPKIGRFCSKHRKLLLQKSEGFFWGRCVCVFFLFFFFLPAFHH